MPVRTTYPGVYVQEVPSGVRAIAGVATSTAAFVGTFPRGPVDVPVTLYGIADFEREYGGLSAAHETSYAVQQFFLNGGGECVVVRVVGLGDPAADPPVPGAGAASGELLDEAGTTLLITYTAGRMVGRTSAPNPGSWGNDLRVEVDHVTRPPAGPAEVRNLFNLTVSLVRIDGGRTAILASERYLNLSLYPGPDNAVDTVNQASQLIQLALETAVPGPPTAGFRPAASGTTSAPLAAGAPVPGGGKMTAALTGPGQPGAIAIPEFEVETGDTFLAAAERLQAALRAQAGKIDALPLRPYLADATVTALGANTADDPSRFVVQLGRGARPFEAGATLALAGTVASNYKFGATGQVQQFAPATTGVDDQAPPGVALSQYLGSRAAKTGLYALEHVDLFNILCIPDAAAMADAGEMRALYTAAEQYCEERRAMLLVDVPARIDRLEKMQGWLADNAGLRHRNAAVYFPRTRISDPLARGRLRSIAPSGAIAGLYARTDAQRGVWKAPAGTDARLRNVEMLDTVLTDQENGALNPLGVNCLRTFPVYSNICWGARTLDGADQLASDWKYVPVRRLTLFLEESLYRGTQWVVFEPNDEPLWAQIRLNVGAFMHDLFRKGAFQGKTPAEAFFVRCDATTTTQTDVDNGIVNIQIGFAPLKPAEFVILSLQQIARRTDG